jgi:hypothetical protein
MRDDLTIIYYTSNREEESFEAKIKQKLLAVSKGIPIVSVSYKPIDLGKNICVGEHYPSNTNLFKQILIGCREAKTPFVINAEADFLYPPEYFTFRPTDKNTIYRYRDIKLLLKYHYGFFRKIYLEGAQIAGREFLISILEKALKDFPEWIEDDSSFHRRLNPYWRMSFEYFGEGPACISFKTGEGLRKSIDMRGQKSIPALPYWGSADDIRKEMFSL